MLILIILLILVFGGGFGGYYGPQNNWSGPHYLGGGIGLILLILLVLFAWTGSLGFGIR